MVSRRQWFMRFLLRSLTQRVGRVAVATFSVTIAVAIVVSALGLSRGIRDKLGHELKAYGANIIVTSPAGLDQREAEEALSTMPGVDEFTFQLYGSVMAGSAGSAVSAVSEVAAIELIGMDIDESKGWKLAGRLPLKGAGEALVGSDVQAALNLELGGALELEGEKFSLVGFVERGGPEDGAVMLWLPDAQVLLERPGTVSAALVRAEPGGLEEVVGGIRRALSVAEVKTLRQVARAEEIFLGKIELLMGLVSIVVLLAASISLSSTMSATVLERLKEIGLMKAIGGTRRGIGVFFVSEGTAIGVMGGVAGYLLGVLAAMAVSKGAFGSIIIVPAVLLPLGVALGVVISVVASLVPLLGALRCKPSVILRGE
ncbi:MAG: ABC transporter permease [Thermodesulfovibrionales bacterium]|nr:ABC transporter permease [Thermodesulfovibrionales bacterium]